jgi:hypothetical protein
MSWRRNASKRVARTTAGFWYSAVPLVRALSFDLALVKMRYCE